MQLWPNERILTEKMFCVHLTEKPSLNVDTLKDMTVKVGEPIELYVEMSGSPAPTVEWSKGSAKVSESDRVQVITTPRDATLLINHAQMGDTSSYKINVNNKHGSQTASVNVKVIGEYNLLLICEEGFITMWRYIAHWHVLAIFIQEEEKEPN